MTIGNVSNNYPHAKMIKIVKMLKSNMRNACKTPNNANWPLINLMKPEST